MNDKSAAPKAALFLWVMKRKIWKNSYLMPIQVQTFAKPGYPKFIWFEELNFKPCRSLMLI